MILDNFLHECMKHLVFQFALGRLNEWKFFLHDECCAWGTLAHKFMDLLIAKC